MTIVQPNRVFAFLLVALGVALGAPAEAQVSEQLVQAYLWPTTAAEFRQAEAALAADPSLVGVTRMQMHDLEELMRSGPAARSGVAAVRTGDSLDQFVVEGPGGRAIPVFVRLPTRYTHDNEWPLMFAMHGGPPGSADGAVRSALRMIQVWAEAAEAAGWIVASPAMVSTVAADGRTRDRLPYEIFHPEEARAVIDAVRKRYNVAPDRIVSTGISLGSNFSIGFGAAHPDWFGAIVPVSTEGDSRELLLRNLQSVSMYLLEGSQDQNIRGVGGPRALNNILTSFGYDLTYREFSDRAHEGFQEHYPDVLRWLDSRPRQVNPREVLRVPHSAIMPVARRVHWIETDTRQALVRARVSSPTRIDITARWAGELTLFLNDRLVDLDQPIAIWVNGERVFHGAVERSIRTALEEARRLNDGRRVYAARVVVALPATDAAIALGRGLWQDFAPQHPEGQLSFWEMYATRALEERFPSVGLTGDEVPFPASVVPSAPEQVAVRVTHVEADGPAGLAGVRTGDLLMTVGGEPFFRGRGGVSGLHRWMMRELRTTPAEYPITVWRGDREVTLTATYRLGSYGT